MYRETLERVIHTFTVEPYGAELKVAREDYFRRTGKVFEDETTYEHRMTAFLEWYLLDRTLWDTGVPPVRLFFLMFGSTLNESERKILEGLQHTIHSLFQYVAKKDDTIELKNLVTSGVYRVKERRSYAGIQRGDILDARLVTIGEKTLLCDALWVHPRDSNEFILKELGKKQDTKREVVEELLFDLAYMKLKRDRYQHLPTTQIYNWDTLARDKVETQRRSVGVS